MKELLGNFILTIGVLVACSVAALAGTVVPLTADIDNSSVAAFGSSVDSPLIDPFAYDPDDPIFELPVQIYNPGAAGFHGSEADGVDVVVSYTFNEVTLNADQTFAIDLYGRDADNDCCAERDDDFDVELFSGGIGGTVVASFPMQAIPNEAPFHLRVSHQGTVAFDALRITARDTDNPNGSYFTLMEIRAAVLDPIVDGDGDGLSKEWEEANGLDDNDNGDIDPNNGAAGDPDADLLSNIDEFTEKTDPQDADSDDDMLEDGSEVTGAGSRPPTNPLAADTDGDTLSDFVETNTGTFVSATDTGSNPTLTDTDADGTSDSVEVTNGTDPSDPGSGGNLVNGIVGGYFDATGNPVDTWAGLPASNVTDGNLDSISHTLDMVSTDFYYEIDLGAEFTLSALAITGRTNCCPDRLVDPTFMVLDALGNMVFSQVLGGEITITQEFDISAASPRGQFVRIINTNGGDYGPQIAELALYGSSAPARETVITAFSFDPVTGDASLTWDSRAGATLTYAVFGSADFSAPVGERSEVSDSVATGGESTTYEFTDLDLIGKTRYFYVVRENLPGGN